MRAYRYSSRLILGVVFALSLFSSTGTAQVDVALFHTNQGPVLRFSVWHMQGLHGDHGYLYFSGSDIGYEVIYPLKNKEHSFQFGRADLVLAKEWYGDARLEFKDGRAYTFLVLRRFILPAEDLVAAANQFDTTVAVARAKAVRRDSEPDLDPLLLSSGEVIGGDGGPVLRFVVAHQSARGLYSSCGYLDFSHQSVRYDVASGRSTDAFTFDRSALMKAKEYDGLAELEFSGGKHRFQPYVPVETGQQACVGLENLRPGEEYGFGASYEVVLEAVNSFPTALEKAEFVNRRVTSRSTVVEMTAFHQKLLGWRAAGAKVDLPEEALHHRVLAEAAFQEKDFAKAASEYERALLIYPTWPEGQFNAALVLGELHRYADAIAHMKAYLELTPDAPDAQKAKQQMWIWEDKMK